MSRRRFMGYATRREFFRPAPADMLPSGRMAVRWSRANDDGDILLQIKSPLRASSAAKRAIYLVGRARSGSLQTCTVHWPARTARVQVTDCHSGHRVSVAKYRRVPFGVEIVLPGHCFAADESFFVRSSRRSVFLCESGWIEVPARASAEEFDSIAARRSWDIPVGDRELLFPAS
jgi:hypothetical protein